MATRTQAGRIAASPRRRELMGTSVSPLAIAGSSILGRGINRRGDRDPFLVVPVSKGIGTALLLMTEVPAQRLL